MQTFTEPQNVHLLAGYMMHALHDLKHQMH